MTETENKYPYIKRHTNGLWLLVCGPNENDCLSFYTYMKAKEAYRRRKRWMNVMFADVYLACAVCGARIPDNALICSCGNNVS